MDQEKGWTLLNRGVVIGSIHFNIEDLILGLSERDCSELKSQESRLLDELNKYRQISNVVKYKESIEHSSGSIVTDFLKEEVNTKLEQKIIEREMIRSDLKRIDRVMQSNKQIKSYIEDLRLLVETPSGDLIPVTSENLHGLNDSIEYLVAKRKIKAAEYKSLSREIEALKNENNNNSNTELFKVESISSAFDEMVRQFPYGYEKIERIISEIKEQLSVVRKQIFDFTRFNNDVVKSLSESILGYAEFLGVGDRATMSSNYLFTSNLKELSGAILHKMVFSFRLAFIKEVKTRIGVTLPIILDSPSGKEIDKDNIQLMIDLLERDFKEHQVIIASIFHYNITNVREIELHNYLME